MVAVYMLAAKLEKVIQTEVNTWKKPM